ncbi:hypothetical protein CIHG_09908 [Coccidioides immitis H538.4]|uniref:Uncharacterized protein n=1 Tax=Coccidioides immitis H538.4 TaxID=396776 RepID=A0A0J8S3N3_COCIT|nr:hypothetical protein CIHG_09908 [Coccidioides immitis H538.4]
MAINVNSDQLLSSAQSIFFGHNHSNLSESKRQQLWTQQLSHFICGPTASAAASGSRLSTQDGSGGPRFLGKRTGDDVPRTLPPGSPPTKRRATTPEPYSVTRPSSSSSSSVRSQLARQSSTRSRTGNSSRKTGTASGSRKSWNQQVSAVPSQSTEGLAFFPAQAAPSPLQQSQTVSTDFSQSGLDGFAAPTHGGQASGSSSSPHRDRHGSHHPGGRIGSRLARSRSVDRGDGVTSDDSESDIRLAVWRNGYDQVRLEQIISRKSGFSRCSVVSKFQCAVIWSLQ